MLICEICNREIKRDLNYKLIDVINKILNTSYIDMCYLCGHKKLKEAKLVAKAQMKSFSSKLEKYLPSIPVMSINNPAGWNYTPKGIVTARANSGTGLVIEVTSTFSDFFGLQSNSTNSKISKCEKLCLSLLKKHCLDLEGNAITGVDIDYIEVGKGKGILMVCMTGTAVRINNNNNLGSIDLERINEATEINIKLNTIKELWEIALTTD